MSRVQNEQPSPPLQQISAAMTTSPATDHCRLSVARRQYRNSRLQPLTNTSSAARTSQYTRKMTESTAAAASHIACPTGYGSRRTGPQPCSAGWWAPPYQRGVYDAPARARRRSYPRPVKRGAARRCGTRC
ncbi:hypothetical protein BC628DRAFT_647910 [Trametes gibbosa]|nr:hypothetical protein BC628DRAFT_647910 [Trametes gibbosa]